MEEPWKIGIKKMGFPHLLSGSGCVSKIRPQASESPVLCLSCDTCFAMAGARKGVTVGVLSFLHALITRVGHILTH